MTEELLEDFQTVIASLALIPSDGGRFEVKVADRLIYSKKQTGRHAEPGEVHGLFREATGSMPTSAQ